MARKNIKEKSIRLYQLGEYNTKKDLSTQSKTVRDQILKKRDFETLYALISGYEELEFETVLILRKAINAGNWDSYYGLSWTNEHELKFWQKVHSKSKTLTLSNLQLLRTLQTSGQKKVSDLKKEYIELLNLEPGLYYELMNEDLVEIWQIDKKLKEACLKALLIHYSSHMELNEFMDEVNFVKKTYFSTEKIPESLFDVIQLIKSNLENKC